MLSRCLSLSILLVLFFGLDDTFAQRRVSSFNNRPPISPYVNLFNNNTGGVNNYFQFVRPLQQQSRINQQQFNQTTRLQRQLLQPNQGNLGAAPFSQNGNGMLRQGAQGIGMPAQAATYFNYSHFYAIPQTQGGLGNRRSGGF